MTILGQVISGRKYWADGSPVAGQQFEYGFDDIGNRKMAASGGDQFGANLHYENYSANALNQYVQRTVPGVVDILGAANANATVTLWTDNPNAVAPQSGGPAGYFMAERKGEYFHGAARFDNGSEAIYASLTNLAALNNGNSADYCDERDEESMANATRNSGLVQNGKSLRAAGGNRCIPTSACVHSQFHYALQPMIIAASMSAHFS